MESRIVAESIQGRALVASPNLNDPNFLRTVVYVLQHDEDGALGLVLNRPKQETVGRMLYRLFDQDQSNEQPIYYGGPVEGPLMMLYEHACGYHESESGDGCETNAVGISTEADCILEICAQPQSGEGLLRYRVFDGYSGWGPTQLECELEIGGWLIWDISAKEVFSDADTLWHMAVRQIGRNILAGGIEGLRLPEDPAYN